MEGRGGKRTGKRRTREEMGRRHERERKEGEIRTARDAQIIGHATGNTPGFAFLGAVR